MDKKLFLQRFKKQFWAPTTPSGNPLFKRTAENDDKEMLQIVEKDPDYSTLIEKTWTSPSNIKAIFIGINKSFIVLHKGLSNGNNKIVELNFKGKDIIYPKCNIQDSAYKIFTRDKLVEVIKDGKKGLEPKDGNDADLIFLEKNPIESVLKFALPNLEFIFLSWNAFLPNSNKSEVIQNLLGKNTRFYGACFLEDKADKFLVSYEKQIREYAQSKYKTIYKFIPDLKKAEIYSNPDLDLKQPLKLQLNQWDYDTFLSKWNETLVKDKENKEDTKSEDDLKDLVCLNKGFTANYQGNQGIEVQKRDDYTVKINLCVPGKDYYNDLEDVHYTGDKTKVVITGTASEVWLTKPQKVIDTYVKLDGSPITKEDFMNLGGGTLEVKPKPNSNKCFAYQVPVGQKDKFYIATPWGDNLKINSTYAKGTQNAIMHGDGDWVICYGKDGKPDLENQSVVNGLIFKNTYKQWEEVAEKNLNFSEQIEAKKEEVAPTPETLETEKAGEITPPHFDDLSETNNKRLEELFGNYKRVLESQRDYVLGEFSVAILCSDSVKLLQQDSKANIELQTCKDLISSKLYKNGEEYYNIITDPQKFNKNLENIIEFLHEKLLKKEDLTPNSPIYIQIADELAAKCSLVVVKDYVENTAIKFIVYSKDPLDEERIKSHTYFGEDSIGKEKIQSTNKDLKFKLVRYEFGRFLDQEAFEGKPFFATRLKSAIVKSVKSGNFNPVIGRDYNNKVVSLPFNGASIDQKFVFLVAGSRSGKGVLTLCQLSEALAKGYNTFYIDCKPDMAMNLYNDIALPAGRETFAVDGFIANPDKKVNISVKNKFYVDYAVEQMEKDAPGISSLFPRDQLSLFVNLIGYTRAVGDITRLAQEQSFENSKVDKKFGETPCFVVIDEIEQYSNKLNEMFFAGEQPSKNLYGGIVGQLISNANTPEPVKIYLQGLIRYIKKVWNDFGNLSQSVLGQSLLKIFVICQQTTIDGWCKPVANALSAYNTKATYILGRGTHAGAGSTKYGCQGLPLPGYSEKAENYLGMGKFILRKNGTGLPFKSIFLLNTSTRGEDQKPSSYVEDMYRNLNNDAVRSLVNKELFGIDSAATFQDLKDKPLIEPNIGFTEFASYLIKQKGKEHDLPYYLEKGYKYLKDCFYTKTETLWEGFYDYSYEGLGIEKRFETAFIEEIELRLNTPEFKVLLDERYVKIDKLNNAYIINSPGYLEKLKEDKERGRNTLWDPYEKQSKGISKKEDVPANINIFKDLLLKMGTYKDVKSLHEEMMDKIEADVALYTTKCEEEGKAPTEDEIAKYKDEITEKYKKEYNDDSAEDISEYSQDVNTEYMNTITKYAMGKSYNKVFNTVARLNKEANCYYITDHAIEKDLQIDQSGLWNLYEGQLGKQGQRGPKKSKAEAEEQTDVLTWLEGKRKDKKLEPGAASSAGGEDGESPENEGKINNGEAGSESYSSENREIITKYNERATLEKDVFDFKRTENGEYVITENASINNAILTKDELIPTGLKGKDIQKLEEKWAKDIKNNSIQSIETLRKNFMSALERAMNAKGIKARDVNTVAFELDRIVINGTSFGDGAFASLPIQGFNIKNLFTFNSSMFAKWKNLIAISMTESFPRAIIDNCFWYDPEMSSEKTLVAYNLFNMFGQLKQIQFIRNGRVEVITDDAMKRKALLDQWKKEAEAERAKAELDNQLRTGKATRNVDDAIENNREANGLIERPGMTLSRGFRIGTTAVAIAAAPFVLPFAICFGAVRLLFGGPIFGPRRTGFLGLGGTIGNNGIQDFGGNVRNRLGIGQGGLKVGPNRKINRRKKSKEFSREEWI